MEQLGDDIRRFLAARLADPLEPPRLHPRHRPGRSASHRRRRRGARRIGNRAQSGRHRSHPASDPGLSTDLRSSPHFQPLTFGLRRAPAGDDQPRSSGRRWSRTPASRAWGSGSRPLVAATHSGPVPGQVPLSSLASPAIPRKRSRSGRTIASRPIFRPLAEKSRFMVVAVASQPPRIGGSPA